MKFLRGHPLAVQASVSPGGAPEAAVVGIIVTDAFEVFFDATTVSRKVPNLRANPKIALVVGGSVPGEERTAQFQGVADEPIGDELDQLKKQYFETFPDARGREEWPDIAYIRARPDWIRYSDYTKIPPVIVEFTAEELRKAAGENAGAAT